MSEQDGCSDGGCIMVDDHSGMRTNGGCKCIEDVCMSHRDARPIRWRIMRLIAERNELRRDLAAANARHVKETGRYMDAHRSLSNVCALLPEREEAANVVDHVRMLVRELAAANAIIERVLALPAKWRAMPPCGPRFLMFPGHPYTQRGGAFGCARELEQALDAGGGDDEG